MNNTQAGYCVTVMEQARDKVTLKSPQTRQSKYIMQPHTQKKLNIFVFWITDLLFIEIKFYTL